MIFEVKFELWFWSRRNRKWSEKACGFAARNILFKFKVEWENGVWTKICFLSSGFFVHIRQFHFDYYSFFDFLDQIFF